MSAEKERNEKILCAILLVIAIFFVSMALLAMVKGPEARYRKAKYLIDHQCEVAGYYGRSGDYKVYSCRGVLVKEGDI